MGLNKNKKRHAKCFSYRIQSAKGGKTKIIKQSVSILKSFSINSINVYCIQNMFTITIEKRQHQKIVRKKKNLGKCRSNCLLQLVIWKKETDEKKKLHLIVLHFCSSVLHAFDQLFVELWLSELPVTICKYLKDQVLPV